MRILVCGGTNINDKEIVYKILDDLHHSKKIDAIITNDLMGANNFAWRWSLDREVYGIFYYTEEKKYGSDANKIRNERMVIEGNPDIVIKFSDEVNNDDIIDIAKNTGKEIINVECGEI